MRDSLQRRIERLERSVRLHRLAVVMAGLAAITCGSGITSSFGLVRTVRLDIVDDADKVHMSVTGKGGGTIAFDDGQGTVVLDAATLRRLIQAAPAAGPQ